MAIIFDSIYLGRNSVSIQVKAHEVHILERKSLLEYKENDDEVESDQEDVEVESEREEDDLYENDEVL